jgi:serine protease SohB
VGKSAKKKHKQEAKAAKAKAKSQLPQDDVKPRVYVLDFKGSMDAHEVTSLRRGNGSACSGEACGSGGITS